MANRSRLQINMGVTVGSWYHKLDENENGTYYGDMKPVGESYDKASPKNDPVLSPPSKCKIDISINLSASSKESTKKPILSLYNPQTIHSPERVESPYKYDVVRIFIQ